MKNAQLFILYTCLFIAYLLMGCGSTSVTQPIGADIIRKYNFHIEGDPITSNLTLPQQYNDANWGPKENVCEQAGYSLLPFAGENISLTKFSITEKYSTEPLYLWVLSKNQTCICAYLSVRENSNAAPGVLAVNSLTINN